MCAGCVVFGCVCFGCKAWLCDKFFAFRLIRDFGQFCVALENFALCMIKDFEHWLKSWWLLSQHHKKLLPPKSYHPKIRYFAKSAQIAQNFSVILRKISAGFLQNKILHNKTPSKI